MKRKPAKTTKSPSTQSRKKITLTKSTSHAPINYKIPRTAKEIEANFQLLFALQRLSYPELKPGLRMDKTKAGFRNRKG